MADNLLEILISFGLDKAQAEEALVKISQLKKESQESTDALSKGAEKAAEKLGDVATSAEESGASLMGAFTPAAIGIAAGTFILQAFFNRLEEIRREAEVLQEVLARQVDLSGLVNGFGEGLGALDKASEKVAAFYDEWDRRSQDTKSFKTRADAIIAELGRIAAKEKELAQEEGRRDLAKLEMLKAQGKISPAELAQGKAAIEEATMSKREVADKKLAAQTLAQLESERAKAAAAAESGKAQVAAAEQAASAAERKVIAENKQLESSKRRVDENTKLLTGDGKTPGLLGLFDNLPPEIREQAEKIRANGPGAVALAKSGINSALPGQQSKLDAAFDLLDRIADVRMAQGNNAGRAQFLGTQLPADKLAAEQARRDADEVKRKAELAAADERALAEQIARRKAESAASAPLDSAISTTAAEAGRYRAGAVAAQQQSALQKHILDLQRQLDEVTSRTVDMQARTGEVTQANITKLQQLTEQMNALKAQQKAAPAMN